MVQVTLIVFQLKRNVLNVTSQVNAQCRTLFVTRHCISADHVSFNPHQLVLRNTQTDLSALIMVDVYSEMLIINDI
jgi:hypothetical protein